VWFNDCTLLRRLSHDEARGQQNSHGVGTSAFDALEEHGGADFAHALEGQCKGGDGYGPERGKLSVVVADDSKVVGNRQSACKGAVDGARGHIVVRTEDRIHVGAALEQDIEAVGPRFGGEVAMDHPFRLIEVDAAFLKGAGKAGKSLDARKAPLRACDHGRVSGAPRHEVEGGLSSSCNIIGLDRRQRIVDKGVDGNGRQVECGPHFWADRLAHAVSGDNAIHPALAQKSMALDMS